MKFGIYHVSALFGDSCTQRSLDDGRLVRAIPERVSLTIPERFRAAWSVFNGRSLAVIPPEDGDFEKIQN